jgi:hypothetical protein
LPRKYKALSSNSSTKKKKIEIKIIVLSEISQEQDKYYRISLLYGILKT